MDKNQLLLIKLAHTKMPFGKYEGNFDWFTGILCSGITIKGRPTRRAVKTNLVKTERTRRIDS
jgi:hypothetical protein